MARLVYLVITENRVKVYSSHAKRDALLHRVARRYKLPTRTLLSLSTRTISLHTHPDAVVKYQWPSSFEFVSARVR